MKGADFEQEWSFGEEMHAELVKMFALETEAWATERVARVMERLQLHREPATPFKTEILWIGTPTAFTVPGGYVYLSRELLQRAATDDPIAFIVAHEIAHHELGHFNPFRKHIRALPRVPIAFAATAILRAIEWSAIGPEAEMDADARALDLCLTSGYDGDQCLTTFDILEAYALDHRDLDMAYGPDEALEPGDTPWSRRMSQARKWMWERTRGYMPIRERKEILRYQLGYKQTSRA